jgi:hypothetical protein
MPLPRCCAHFHILSEWHRACNHNGWNGRQQAKTDSAANQLGAPPRTRQKSSAAHSVLALPADPKLCDLKRESKRSIECHLPVLHAESVC